MSHVATKLPVPEFVSKVMKDATRPVDVILLAGYPGASPANEHTRLYLNAQLSQYLDIANDAIVHFQPVQPESSPPGCVHVWVERGVTAGRSRADADRGAARFLNGPIAFAAGAGPQGPIPNAASIGGVGGGCDTPACTGAHITCWENARYAGPPIAGAASIGGVGGGCDTPACTGAHITCWQVPFAPAWPGYGGPRNY